MNQSYEVNGKKYHIHDCIRHAQDLPVREIPLDHLCLNYYSPCSNNIRSFAEHMKQVNEVDMDKPIILNEDGVIIDGRHRLCHALVYGFKTIKAVRFEEDPKDCYEIVEE